MFRCFLLAAFTSNVGTWMHDVGASWLMLSLTPSPVMVALVQTAVTLPVFALALPAGVLGDLVDRRKLLITTQCWMLTIAAALGIIGWFDLITPWLLITFTFLLSCGAAATAPAWQSVVPDLVARSQLSSAVILRDISFNAARMIGPALGGLILGAITGASRGAAVLFLINAASFFSVVIVLTAWNSPRCDRTSRNGKKFVQAMLIGARYVRETIAVRAVVIRAGVFVFFESALWAILPLLARYHINASAGGYGVLMACLGVGAIIGGTLVSALRARLGFNMLINSVGLLAAAMLILLSAARSFSTAVVAMLISGVCWITTIMSFNIILLEAVPDSVRSRVMAIFQFVFFGCFAGGSLLWGQVAKHTGLSASIAVAGVGMTLAMIALQISLKRNAHR